MAKLKIDDLKTVVAEQVLAEKAQNAEYEITTETVTGLVEKIAKTDVLVPNVNDTLDIFDKGELPDGADIEQMFMEIVAPEDGSTTGATALAPRYATYLKNYSKALEEKVFPISIRRAGLRKVIKNPSFSGYADLVVRSTENMLKAKKLYKFFVKKQALSDLIRLCVDDTTEDSRLSRVVNEPVDTATSKKIVQEILKAVEDFQFASEKNTIAGNINASASNNLVIVMRKGIEPMIKTELYAQLMNPSYADITVTTRIVDDFGTNYEQNVACVIGDKSLIELWDIEDFIVPQGNGESSHETYFNHYLGTVIINPFVPVRVLTIVEPETPEP